MGAARGRVHGTVLRVNLDAAGAVDAEQVLERLTEAERVLEWLVEAGAGGGLRGAPAGAGAEVEVVEVGFAGGVEGPQDTVFEIEAPFTSMRV